MASYFQYQIWEDRAKDKGPNPYGRKRNKEKLQEQGKHCLKVEKKTELIGEEDMHLWDTAYAMLLVW